jgi:hypothetical protein
MVQLQEMRDEGGTMTDKQTTKLRLIEGQQVNIALRDGTRLDDCNLVSSGRNRLDTLWLFVNGEDVFVPCSDVVDFWEADSNRPWAA